VHVTEMMTCDWSMIIVDVFKCREVVLCYLFIYLIFSNMFTYGARNSHSRRTRNEKSVPVRRRRMESIYGAGVSWALLMPATHAQKTCTRILRKKLARKISLKFITVSCTNTTLRPITFHGSCHVPDSFFAGIELCSIACKKLVQEKQESPAIAD